MFLRSSPRFSTPLSALLLALGLAIGLSPAPARAEKADREKPVNIEADRMFYDDLRQLNIFEGNVTLTQGTLIIRTDKLTVKQDPEGFQHGTADKGAEGLAYFRQKRDNVDEYIEGWGERIEYDAKTDKADLITRARIVRGSDKVTGNTINYNGRTEEYVVIGGQTASGANACDRRVCATLQPNKTAPGATPPAPGSGINLKSAGKIDAPRSEVPEGPKK
jgi:lipopolysaccharide export system protein LptA